MVGDGFADGILFSSGKSEDASKKMAEDAFNGVDVLDEKFGKAGEDAGEALADGIKKTSGSSKKAAEDSAKKAFEAFKSWMDERKSYNQLSLLEELTAWEEASKRYKEESEERIAIDKEVYRVKLVRL